MRHALSFCLLPWLAVGLSAMAAVPGPGAADFYISPHGDDAWSGKHPNPTKDGADGPFATLERAREAVHDQPHRDVTVLLRGGLYRLRQTICFSLADSAGPDRSITYAAYPGETPVLSAGIPVTGWRRVGKAPPGLPAKAAGHVWAADVSSHPAMRPAADGRSPRFFTLYDDAGMLRRARGPGFAALNASPRQNGDHRAFLAPAKALKRYVSAVDAELVVIPSRFWVMNILPVETLNSETGKVRTAQPATYPLGRNSMTDRPTAWIENRIEALDEPGEWVLDAAAGTLYLWPRTDHEPQDIVAPALTELIRVEGTVDYDGPVDEPVQGLVFRGLSFRHGDRLPWHGLTGWGLQHDWERFDQPTALVRFRGAERCAVEDCDFGPSGHTALRLDLHCRGNRIVGNHIHAVGGVGILLAGYGPGTKDVNRDNSICNNYIHDIGRIYWGSGGIWAWQSGHNHIAHNLLHGLPYTGILVTGRINRQPPGPGECSRTVRWAETTEAFRNGSWEEREPFLHGRQNIVEYNDISHAMEVLGDGNCIYVSGTGGGNVVRNNYCHDCTGRYMNAVIRCDDDQHQTLIEGNVCCRTGGSGEGIISKGDNDLLNNVIADLRPAQHHRGYIVFPYGSIAGSEIRHNILYSRQPRQILYSEGRGRNGGPAPRLDETQLDYNLYFCTIDGQWAARHLKQRQAKGQEQHSRAADPRFVSPDTGDFGFRPGSPAPELGIRPLDVGLAGLEPRYRKHFLGDLLRTRIEPGDQVVHDPITVRIEAAPGNPAIHYTLDGSEPTANSPVYTAPFELRRAATVRARAFAADATDLYGAIAHFTLPPSVREDFEAAAVGATAPAAVTQEEEKVAGFTARVTDEQAAEGTHSLKFVDGPGQEHSFNPHVYYRRSFGKGPHIGSFHLRVDANTAFAYQWRQYDGGNFLRGPALEIRPGGQLLCDSEQLLPIPTGDWVFIEVRCELGTGAAATYELRLRLPGEEAPRVFPNRRCERGFRRLDWVGFIAKGTKTAAFYIDNIAVQPATGGD